ncbi:hypothetical protein IFM89_000317 [Coptis chinensis]|uniref:RNase H type-1 domain-containing protein n=1 Tax=Coptis chinensis TaxID=261450 RepID=A0A835HBF0_9MAGN|nr:hypothetical protein IFM89_000317 [Coptis chinensis]
MRLGLSLAPHTTSHSLHIQSDFEALISCIKGNDRDTPWAAAGIIEDIRKLFSSFTNLSLTHIYREANATADTLAQHGISLSDLDGGGGGIGGLEAVVGNTVVVEMLMVGMVSKSVGGGWGMDGEGDDGEVRWQMEEAHHELCSKGVEEGGGGGATRLGV